MKLSPYPRNNSTMPENVVKILMIEDNRAEARLLREVLKAAKPVEFTIVHVRRLSEALHRLDEEIFDAILLDLMLPDSQGLESLVVLSSRVPSLPIVVLTNTNDESLALEAVRNGAQDYLVKRLVNIERLGHSLHYAIERKQISQALLKANEELAQANNHLQQEILERQKVQEELQRSNEELEQFAYIASHDLKQPLCSISSWAQMLSVRYGGKLDAKADRCINYILDGTTRMQQLIDDLLMYSRVGRMSPILEPTNCEHLLESILERLETAISKSQAAIAYDPLPIVMADPVQLGQLFQNLIDNGIKYCQDKAPRIHIGAMLNRGDRDGENHKQDGQDGHARLEFSHSAEWIFSVRDNGIGIDPQHFDRIFMIFQRLHRRDEYPGTGIGLAVCQKIVESHGGRIWVESHSGCGSTFYFTLPAHIAT